MEQNELYRILGNIEGKMDTMLSNQVDATAKMITVEGRVNSVENRITSIEASKDARKADVALLFSVVSAIGVGFSIAKEWLLK